MSSTNGVGGAGSANGSEQSSQPNQSNTADKPTANEPDSFAENVAEGVEAVGSLVSEFADTIGTVAEKVGLSPDSLVSRIGDMIAPGLGGALVSGGFGNAPGMLGTLLGLVNPGGELGNRTISSFADLVQTLPGIGDLLSDESQAGGNDPQAATDEILRELLIGGGKLSPADIRARVIPFA